MQKLSLIKQFKSIAILIASTLTSFASADLCDVTGGVILGDITLNVPSDYTSVATALDCISDKTIAEDAIVTIQIANGTYTNLNTIHVNHPNGDRIHIVGNTADETQVKLNFALDQSGIVVEDGNKLGLIDGLTLTGNTTSSSVYGVAASDSSTIIFGTAVTVDSFGDGILSKGSSSIYCRSVISKNNANSGIAAYHGASIDANSSNSSNNSGDGVVSSSGSSVGFSDGVANNNSNNGIYAYLHGMIRADRVESKTNSGYGVRSRLDSFIFIPSATVTGNTVANTIADSSSSITTSW